MSLFTRTSVLSALLLSTVFAAGCAPADEGDDAPSSEDALSTGTPRRERYVLLQAEVDNAQIEMFKTFPSSTIDPHFVAFSPTRQAFGSRFVVEYDHVQNARGRSETGAPATLKDDRVTLRFEVSF